MYRNILITTICILAAIVSNARQGKVEFRTTDTALQAAFDFGRSMALHYRGNPSDAVGPWYEAALPMRKAFCMRDASHQCVPAEILGMGRENRNMFTHFVSNISEKRDWCTFWEINNTGAAAPEDYRNDSAFWYNLNANFDVMYACWRLYKWTGDTLYLNHPAFDNFHRRSAQDYIRQWALEPDSLTTRRAYPNAPAGFDINDNFHRCRGIPSYVESVPDLRMGVDLVGAIYRGLKTWSEILAMRGSTVRSAQFAQLAERYRTHLETVWWHDASNGYYTSISNEGKFGQSEGATFLLWFDVLSDTSRIKHTIHHLTSNEWNVENLSYLSHQLYRFGYWKEAYKYLLQLAHPSTSRREYPEVSFGIIEGIVQGLMGIDVDARQNRVSSIYRTESADRSSIRHLPLLGTAITLEHAKHSSSLHNEGKRTINWRVTFAGKFDFIQVGQKKMKASHKVTEMNTLSSYIDVKVPGGATVKAFVSHKGK